MRAVPLAVPACAAGALAAARRSALRVLLTGWAFVPDISFSPEICWRPFLAGFRSLRPQIPARRLAARCAERCARVAVQNPAVRGLRTAARAGEHAGNRPPSRG